MGGCYGNGTPEAKANQAHVDQGPWSQLPDVGYPEPDTAAAEALYRVLRHRDSILRANPLGGRFDEPLRCALTQLVTGQACKPAAGSDRGLRYLRDRVNVPRDMSIHAARRLRQSLEDTAAMVGNRQGEPIPVRHRRDQDPARFAMR